MKKRIVFTLLLLVISMVSAFAEDNIDWYVSIPEGNWFYNSNIFEDNDFGFLGIILGLDFLLPDNDRIKVDIGTLTDFVSPIPASPYIVEPETCDFSGRKKNDTLIDDISFYGSLSYIYSFGKLYSGIGIQNTLNLYSFSKCDGNRIISDNMQIYNYGLITKIGYKFKSNFHISVNFLPSFLFVHQKKVKFGYSHMLFLELGIYN